MQKSIYLPLVLGYSGVVAGVLYFVEQVMELFINGEAAHAPPGLTVLELLEHRDLKAREVVVERNLVLVPQDAFAATVLEPGDSLEILHFVGGG